MNKAKYIKRGGYLYGECQECGKKANGKPTDMVKRFQKVNWFRGDDVEIDCWCYKCYREVGK